MTQQHADSPKSLDEQLEAVLDSIQDYCIESVLGGSPFKSEEENKKHLQDTYDSGRERAKQQLKQIIAEERKDQTKFLQAAVEKFGRVDWGAALRELEGYDKIGGERIAKLRLQEDKQ